MMMMTDIHTNTHAHTLTHRCHDAK
jgi:hypothetical protein